MTFKFFTIIIMSLFYISMGLKHIFDCGYFMPMIPPILPCHKLLIYTSGVVEVLLGLGLLFSDYRQYAAFALIILLVIIFPANIYVAINKNARNKMNINKTLSVIRLFFQPVLISIAYWHTY